MNLLCKFLAIFLFAGSVYAADTHPGGTTGQIQYNNNGYFGGTSLVPIINGGTPYTAIVTNSPYNASGYIAQTLTSGSVSSGSTVISVNSTTGFNVGQIAIVALAGTSGTKNFAGTISSISPGVSITLSGTALTGTALNYAGPYGTATSGTSTATTVPANYTVYTLGSTTMSSASSGATTIVLANAASYKVGQGILIFGGAASGANLLTTIQTVSGNTLTISPGIGNAGGVGSGTYVQHDDSAAFQTAVNLVTYNQSVLIFVPDGYYQLNNPSGAGGTAYNGIVNLPSLQYWSSGQTYWYPQSTLEITGNVAAPQMQSYLSTYKIPHLSGAIIQTNLVLNNLFSAPYDSSSLQGYTNIQFFVNNITLRTYPNPNITPINGTYIESLKLTNFSIDTGDTGATTQPTNNSQITNVAVIGPMGANGANNILQNGEIVGYYFGAYISEHTFLSELRFDNDMWPLLLGGTDNYYSIMSHNIYFDGCPHGIGIGATSRQIPIDFSMLNIEHQTSPSWVSPVDDISDTNYLTGFVSIDQVGQTINIAGATDLHVVDGKAPSYPLPTQVYADLSNAHYTSAPNGTVVYCSDCVAASSCAGSGNGAMAQMINGVWSCNMSGVSTTDAQTGTTYTTVLGDAGNLVTMNNASANTITIPPNSSVAYPINTRIDICQIGAGTTTVAAGSGVTINQYGASLALAGQYACASVKKLATNTWILLGNL